MRSLINKTFTSTRLTQTGKKSAYGASTSGECHFRQMDEQTSSINQIQYGLGFKMTVEGSADILVSDIVTIDSIEYAVQGVKKEAMGSLEYTEVVLIKKVG